MRGVVKGAATALARLVPEPAARFATRAWLDRAAARSDPGDALRGLFAVRDELDDRLNAAAIRYDGGVHVKHRLMAYHDFFLARIRPGERVLDLGCGKGELAFDLAERGGAEVVGVDVHEPYLRFARERFRHPRLRFVQADLLEYEPEGQFEAVVLSNVLEHIAPRAELLARIAQRIRPARLLVRVPLLARDWTVPLREELGLVHFSDETHELEYDAETLTAEVEAAGFEVAELRAVWGELWAEARPRG